MSPPPSATKLVGCPAERGRYLGIQRALFLRNRDFTTSNGGRARGAADERAKRCPSCSTYLLHIVKSEEKWTLSRLAGGQREGQAVVEVD